MASKEIVFATNNQGKLSEARSVLTQVDFAVKSLNDFPHLKDIDDIPETGDTFESNALIKAKFVVARVSKPVFADDSGLEVQALNKLPGVNSKRWVDGSDLERNIYLLQQLENQTNRQAQFTTVLCYMASAEAEPIYFSGTVLGMISERIVGERGFGYDSVFIPDGFEITFAEMSQAEKNKLSHRGRALEKLVAYLNSMNE